MVFSKIELKAVLPQDWGNHHSNEALSDTPW